MALPGEHVIDVGGASLVRRVEPLHHQQEYFSEMVGMTREASQCSCGLGALRLVAARARVIVVAESARAAAAVSVDAGSGDEKANSGVMARPFADGSTALSSKC